jgi:hypothetical protein
MFTVNRIPPSFANKSTDGILIYGLIAAFLRTVESVQLRVEVIIAGMWPCFRLLFQVGSMRRKPVSINRSIEISSLRENRLQDARKNIVAVFLVGGVFLLLAYCGHKEGSLPGASRGPE